MKARLLRIFPLVTVAIVLGISWLFLQTENTGNPAIAASIVALFSTVVVVVVVSLIADVIGGEIDKVNADLEATQEELMAANQELRFNADALSFMNKELEAFSYSVSHDLRAPLTHIQGFAGILSDEYAGKLDEKGRNFLARIRDSAKRMGELIEDLLMLSKVSSSELQEQSIDLSEMASAIAARLRDENPGRRVTFAIAPSTPARGDPNLMEVALANLLNNSWKYTSKKAEARIEFGWRKVGERTVYYVKDDGVGFDMSQKDRLFAAFNRLHPSSEFPGTGVGLQTVSRIVARHKGEIWAEGEVDKGATFYFTLGEPRP